MAGKHQRLAREEEPPWNSLWCTGCESASCTWFLTELTSPFSELRAPMSMLLEMLSRWPRYLSQGPAMEMWSVVHLPFTLIRMLAPCAAPLNLLKCV